jgi:hypothetical protein
VLTCWTATWNVTEVAPAGTVTLGGRVRFVLLVESGTVSPPGGAGPFNVTVQVAEPPLGGVQEMLLTTMSKVTVAVAVCPFQLAVMVTVCGPVTVPAVIVKVPLLVPAPTVMVAGTVNVPALLDRFTVARPAAALVNVTVQVAVWAGPSVVAGQLTADSCAGARRFTVKVWLTPLAVAVRIAV